MNMRRLMIGGLVGLFVLVMPLSLLAAAEASTDAGSIGPTRAPAPLVVEASMQGAVEMADQAVTQAAPQPRPVPVAPYSAEQTSSTTTAPSLSGGFLLLLLIASTVVLVLAWAVWPQSDGERLDRQPQIAQGAQA